MKMNISLEAACEDVGVRRKRVVKMHSVWSVLIINDCELQDALCVRRVY